MRIQPGALRTERTGVAPLIPGKCLSHLCRANVCRRRLAEVGLSEPPHQKGVAPPLVQGPSKPLPPLFLQCFLCFVVIASHHSGSTRLMAPSAALRKPRLPLPPQQEEAILHRTDLQVGQFKKKKKKKKNAAVRHDQTRTRVNRRTEGHDHAPATCPIFSVDFCNI